VPEETKRPLGELAAEQTIFIDANIFIYHFTGLSQECSGFLVRCEHGDLWGVTGIHVLLEVLHRLMMVEAVNKGLITPGNVAKKLREKPDVVKQLIDYQIQTEAILEMGIDVVGLTPDHLKASLRYRRRAGLLVNNSLTVAAMEAEGISNLATADPDFARVEAIQVYRPQDIAKVSSH